MRKVLIGLLFLGMNSTFSADLEIMFAKRSSQDVKDFLVNKSKDIVKMAHQAGIEVYKEDFEAMKCMSLGGGVGSCVIDGDAFAPNSSSRWIINVTSPEAPSCDYGTTKVTFQFLDSEC